MEVVTSHGLGPDVMKALQKSGCFLFLPLRLCISICMVLSDEGKASGLYQSRNIVPRIERIQLFS